MPFSNIPTSRYLLVGISVGAFEGARVGRLEGEIDGFRVEFLVGEGGA